MHDVTEVMTMLDEKTRLDKQISKLEIQRNKLVTNIESICPHPTTIKTSKYHTGGYDHVSSVTVIIKCSICNKILKVYDDPNHIGAHA